MYKILLACNAGMSTSLLVLRMQEAAKEKGIDTQIEAMAVTAAETHLKEWDVVMLGPQVRHQIKLLEKASEGVTPVKVINMRDYGLMNGANVLDDAIKTIESHK